MGWYEERFTPKQGRVECKCQQCERPYWLPPSHVGKRLTCGTECRAALNASVKKARETTCGHCGASFAPRPAQLASGNGRFCSVKCAAYGNRQLWKPEARLKAKAALMAAIESGAFVPRKGPKHAQWKGGPSEATRRRTLSGKNKEQLRKYRAARPDVQREAAHRRQSAKVERLPRGTVKRIGSLQRWKCAVCHGCLCRLGYHMDHIMPLAKGGQHTPGNIQLLCPTCNVRKSAKHPIDFMQQRGFLL